MSPTLPGAVNVDRLASRSVNVVADAKALPFGRNTFDRVVAINPADASNKFFNPLAGDVASILKPGGTVTVVAQPRNYAFRQLLRMDGEALRALGFVRLEAATAAESRFIFGQATTVSGGPLDMAKARQLIFGLSQ